MTKEKPFFKLSKELFYIALLGIGVFCLLLIITFKQKSVSPEPMSPPVAYVQTLKVGPSDITKHYLTYGRVKPYKKVALASEVLGQVVELAVEEGSYVKKGQLLFAIDSKDSQNTKEQKEALYQQALLELKLEQGRQKVAMMEWEMLDKSFPQSPINKNLSLRKPHLKAAQARVKGALADLEKSRRRVKKCWIKAPFDAYVAQHRVELGQQLLPGAEVMELVSSEGIYIEASLSKKQIQELMVLNSPEYRVDIVNSSIKAKLLHPLPMLDNQSRLPKVLLKVEGPWLDFSARDKTFPLDSFLSLDFPGETLKEVIKVPREALREGNRVWVKNAKEQLEIRLVEGEYEDLEALYLTKGLDAGEELVVSSLDLPIEGMNLKRYYDEEGS